MAKVELKQPVVAEIAELFNGAKGAVVVDYRGLTVEQDTQLRKQLREAGVVEGNYYDAKGMTAIANVPSREVLLGKLLGSIQSPIANFARVINQIAESKEA